MNRLVLEMERGKTIVYTPFFSPYSTRLKIFLNGREQTKMSTRLASTCVCDLIFLQHSFLSQFTPTRLTVCSHYTGSTAKAFLVSYGSKWIVTPSCGSSYTRKRWGNYAIKIVHLAQVDKNFVAFFGDEMCDWKVDIFPISISILNKSI